MHGTLLSLQPELKLECVPGNDRAVHPPTQRSVGPLSWFPHRDKDTTHSRCLLTPSGLRCHSSTPLSIFTNCKTTGGLRWWWQWIIHHIDHHFQIGEKTWTCNCFLFCTFLVKRNNDWQSLLFHENQICQANFLQIQDRKLPTKSRIYCHITVEIKIWV